MFDYSKYSTLVIEKLEIYGQDLSILDANFNAVSSTKAIMANAQQNDIPATLVGKVNAIFYSVPNDNILKDNYIKWNGDVYSIVEIETTNLTNQKIITKIYVSTGG